MLILEGESPANLAFTPDGTRLITKRIDKRVIDWRIDVWAVSSRERLHSLGPIRAPYRLQLAIHPCGRFAFAATGGRLVALSMTDGGIVADPTDATPVEQVMASPDGKRVLAVSTGQRLLGFHCSPEGELSSAWDTEAGSVSYPEALGSFLGTGDRFATIGSGQLFVRDVSNGGVQATVPYPSYSVGSGATSHDGSRFVAMAYGKLYVWDTVKWGKPTLIEWTVCRRDNSFAFHPTRPLLASIQQGQTLVKFFDTTTWKPVSKFQWKLGEMVAVTFSPDGMLAAASTASGKIVVWDVDV